MPHHRLYFAFALSAFSSAAVAQNDAPTPPADPASAQSQQEPAASGTSKGILSDGAADGYLGISARKEWVLRIDPTVWWVSPEGDLKLPGSGGSGGHTVELNTLNLDTPEFTPAGSLAINAGNFRFSFFGAAYSRDTGGFADGAFQLGDVSFADGDPFETDFEFNLFEITAGYRFLSYDWKERTKNKEKAVDVVLDLYGIAGGRLYDMDIGIASPGGASSDTDQFFGDIVGGVRGELIILRDFQINVQLSAGGMGDSDRSSFSWDIQISGEWHPFENVGVQVGWRHVDFSFEDGDGPEKFDFDGSLAGVFAGIVIRF